MRLLQQPLRQVAGSIIILIVRRQFPAIRIFIVKPGIPNREDRTLPNPTNRHDHVAGIGERRSGGLAQLQGTQFFNEDLL